MRGALDKRPGGKGGISQGGLACPTSPRRRGWRLGAGASTPNNAWNPPSLGVLISLVIPGLISMSIEETAVEPASNRVKRRVGGSVLVAAGTVIGLAGLAHLILYGKDSF